LFCPHETKKKKTFNFGRDFSKTHQTFSQSRSFASITGKTNYNSNSSNPNPKNFPDAEQVSIKLENRINQMEKRIEERITKLEEERSENAKAISKLSSDIGQLTLTISSLVQTLSPQKKQNRPKRHHSSPEIRDKNLEPEYSPVSKPITKRQKIPAPNQNNVHQVSAADFEYLQSLKKEQEISKNCLESQLAVYFKE
jgi:hypothetical protein